MNHSAIRLAYPEVVTINDSIGALDADGNLVELDEKLIEEASKQLDLESKIEAKAKAEAKAAAEAKLAALGLTAEDLKAIGF